MYPILRSFLAVALLAPVVPAATIGFVTENIASDQPGVAANTDPNMVNSWGLTSSSTSPLWIGANATGVSLVYNGAGVKLPITVSIPGDGSVTGVAFSGTAGFNGNAFLFASEDGTVSGWRQSLGTAAETLVAASEANVYKGITDATIAGNSYAYLANFRNGTIDVVKGNSGAPDLTGSFTDPNLPAGYAPFNVQNINGTLYVTYAVQDAGKHDDVAGAGDGIVDRFDLNGIFLGRLVTGGSLNSPWGLALAPSGFGDVGGDLLVGNFGDGMIHAYTSSGALVETLMAANATPLTIDGLWGLRFGNGGAGGSAGTLFFTAGPDDEKHGLFGQITPTPEPGAWSLAALGALVMVMARRRSRRGPATTPSRF